jgi:hypothetical protein
MLVYQNRTVPLVFVADVDVPVHIRNTAVNKDAKKTANSSDVAKNAPPDWAR